MIAILDYGMGNVASMRNMVSKIGSEVRVLTTLKDVPDLTGVILPGVGAFDNAMTKLSSSGLQGELRHAVLEQRIPFLGVCLGMQLLFERSEEGNLPGLGFLSGSVVRFAGEPFSREHLRIPHMGWNVVEPTREGGLFQGLGVEPRFYFVHSYHVVCGDQEDTAATCEYGYPFSCAVARGNIFATQFHPEKSHKFGMKLLQNFLELTC